MNCPICEEEMKKIKHENFTEYKCSDCGISEVKANIDLKKKNIMGRDIKIAE